jgi:hypothetical protein
LGGGTPPTLLGRASHLAILLPKRERNLGGIGNSSRIWKEFAGAAPRELIGAGSWDRNPRVEK